MMSAQITRSTEAGFRPVATISLSWGDGGPVQAALLPVPIKRAGSIYVAAFELAWPTPRPNMPSDEVRRIRNDVSIPMRVLYLDPLTGNKVDSTGPGYDLYNRSAPEHFGIANPPGRIVGHFDDPNWLPPDRLAMLRERIFAALDVLLPFFADENRPWTEAANKAAREVRDFFPLAAEPGLWPYYKAEGKEFFAWVDRSAPPGKAALPWDVPARSQ
jgi:hypothetical protein